MLHLTCIISCRGLHSVYVCLPMYVHPFMLHVRSCWIQSGRNLKQIHSYKSWGRMLIPKEKVSWNFNDCYSTAQMQLDACMCITCWKHTGKLTNGCRKGDANNDLLQCKYELLAHILTWASHPHYYTSYRYS